MEEPKIQMSASELNKLIRKNFQVFEGPPNRYIELPIEVHGSTVHWIRGYMLLGFKGPEHDCAQRIFDRLIEVRGKNILNRVGSPCTVFIRSWFEYDKAAKFLGGRLLFWDTEMDTILRCDQVFRVDERYGPPS